VTSSSFRAAAGKFLYAVRVQHGITDRKRTEQLLAGRMEEQAALFAFSERLQHCASAGQVYDAAIAAITRALGCTERPSCCSIPPTSCGSPHGVASRKPHGPPLTGTRHGIQKKSIHALSVSRMSHTQIYPMS
jgi:hypothetical protein